MIIVKVNYYIWGIDCFGIQSFVTILFLKDVSEDWGKKVYLNWHWSRLLNDVGLLDVPEQAS